eukprot:5710466-Prymnesium_polylepis.1
MEEDARPSQAVLESSAATPNGKNIVVTLERTSTGGTRHEAQFQRAAGGAMSAAERANKKRKRATLFPAKDKAAHEKDAERKRKAAAPPEAVAAAECTEEEAEIVERRKQRQHRYQLKRAEDGAYDLLSQVALHMEYAIHGDVEPCPCYLCREDGKSWQPSDVSDQCRRRALEHMLQTTFCPCADCRNEQRHSLQDEQLWMAVNAELGCVPRAPSLCPMSYTRQPL